MSESLRLPLGPELERGPEVSVIIEGRTVKAYLGGHPVGWVDWETETP